MFDSELSRQSVLGTDDTLVYHNTCIRIMVLL